jgi:uncharacterized protein (TIGR02231 family)
VVDPAPWQLVIRPPAAAREAVAKDAMSEARPAAPMARRERADDPALQMESQYATEFEVPGTVELPSDGRQVSVSLAKQTFEARQRIRIVPRREPVALVTAEAPLPEGVWIPGEVQLYRDGAYIGATFWQAQAKPRLVLPFGRDDRVQVAVSRLKNRGGDAGWVGSRVERQVSDLYTVSSRHKVPVELLVLEASPVAVSDDIRVEAAFEPKPKVVNWEDRRGVVAWEQPLAPGQTLKFVADYTISYPKDAVVSGLP